MTEAAIEVRATQDAVRAANERFRDFAVASAWGEQPIPFLCECADSDCLAEVVMTSADYAATHADVDHYVILRGHPIADGESVVDDRVTYLVMLKVPAPAQ
jgi:hypothetical protein